VVPSDTMLRKGLAFVTVKFIIIIIIIFIALLEVDFDVIYIYR